MAKEITLDDARLPSSWPRWDALKGYMAVRDDEGKAAEYQERAQALRENARGILHDKTRRELLRQADECEAIAAALAGKRDKARK